MRPPPLLLLLLPLLSLSSAADHLGHTCHPNRTHYPCRSYAFFRASAPDLLDLAAIGDLFGTTRAIIASASNISDPASPLYPTQPLIIPLTCSCSSNHSYALVLYQIKKGDTFYHVSTFSYQNLTTYQAVELVNPTQVPTRLEIGDLSVFPVFCQCPANSVESNGSSGPAGFLVTYVVQLEDTYASIADGFGVDLRKLVALNGGGSGRKLEYFSTVLVPVSNVPISLGKLEKGKRLPVSSPPSVSPPPLENEIGGSGGGSDIVVIGLASAVGVLGAMLVLLLMFVLHKSGFRRRVGGKDTSTAGQMLASDWSFVADIYDCLDKYIVFQIEELRGATSNFESRCIVNGSVYKGWLNGCPYAIKKMKWNAGQELRILQKVNHTNLVKLEGFCINPEDGTCYLVYEYIENGSLYSWLHDSIKRSKLDWKTRLKIAFDVANGLQYIHEHTWPTVVHKDICSSNVLLDGMLRAKIANFGLSRSGCNAMTTHIVGTQGYIAPEYLVDGLVTTKIDVFAYGVVLLELISGKEAVDVDGETLLAEVEKVFDGMEADGNGRLLSWMDRTLVEQSCPIESVVSVMAVARACVQRDPSERPSMVDIVYTLSKADDLYSY